MHVAGKTIQPLEKDIWSEAMRKAFRVSTVFCVFF